MLYLVTATYYEAYGLIKRYRLKKETSYAPFQTFYSADAKMRLIITGSGMLSSAVAVGSLCATYKATPDDFLINVGICAGTADENQIFLCNKIIEQSTGKTFYPDFLYRHSFLEASITTGAKPLRQTKQNENPLANTLLYDMEASSIYQAGAYFFGPHQMSFLKIVSDKGNPSQVTADVAKRRVLQNLERIADYLDRLSAVSRESEQKRNLFGEKEFEGIRRLCDDMRCSKAMADAALQLIRYGVLSNANCKEIIKDMYREKKIPCKNKREGKRCVQELKQKLL